MSLAKAETETVITMNDEDAFAVVWTCQRRMTTQMRKRGIEPVEQDGYGARYHVPKNWIKINPPRRVSEEQRKRASRLRGTSIPHRIDSEVKNPRSNSSSTI